MKCDLCSQRDATVHLTEIVNKKKKELHLCEECAREKGGTLKVQFSAEVAHVSETLAAAAEQKSREEALACPVCGITFAEFRSSGRLGCANDYAAFRKGLVPLLEKIHGHIIEHRGKVPAHVGERIDRQKKLQGLKQALNRAIQKEEYEKAAELRDQIHVLEAK